VENNHESGKVDTTGLICGLNSGSQGAGVALPPCGLLERKNAADGRGSLVLSFSGSQAARR